MVAEATVAGAVLPATGTTVRTGPALTARQAEIVGYIRGSLATRGYPPTIRELAEALQIKSTNGVTDHLHALARKGILRITPRVSRGITLLPGAAS